tara:strand:+ start:359 stop:763 length:405 start_codon:yes stop_codon:yes gene_type:complete
MTNEGCDFFLFVDYAKINQTYFLHGERILRSATDDWLSLIIAGGVICGVGYAFYENAQVQETNNFKSQAFDECVLKNNITMDIEDEDPNMKGLQIKNSKEKTDRYIEQITRLCSGLDEYEQEIMIRKMKEIQDD